MTLTELNQDLRKLSKHRTFGRKKVVCSMFLTPKSPYQGDFKK